MKPYPHYKSTGLAWLPSVPEHWELRQLKRMAKLKGGCGFPIDKQGQFNNQIRFIKVNALSSKIDPHRVYDTVSDTDVQTLNATVFKKGAIVFAKVGAALMLRRFEELPFDSCIDNNMMGIFEISENPKWLRYALSLLDFGRIVNPGAVPSVNQSQVGTMILPLPPPSEQSRIVRYLDEKTAAINELVRAKERQIELLRERKQALVSAAVTGGAGNLNTEAQRHRDTEEIHSKSSEPLSLCDSVLKTGTDAGDGVGEINTETQRRRGAESNLAGLPEFRDSGVPWIGKIPKGWSVVKFKRIAKVCANLVEPNQYADYPQIAPECIEKGSGRLVMSRTVRDAGIVSGNHLFKAGQILYSKIRPTLNKVVIAPCDGLCSADMYPIETTQNKRWFLFFMLSSPFVQQVTECCARVKMPKINKEDLGQLLIAVPPLPEQRRIVEHLDGVCSELDAAEAAIRKQISLLQELRTRLVSDAVTGAVEV